MGAGQGVAVGGQEIAKHIVGGEAEKEGGGEGWLGHGGRWGLGWRESGGGSHGVVVLPGVVVVKGGLCVYERQMAGLDHDEEGVISACVRAGLASLYKTNMCWGMMFSVGSCQPSATAH